MSNTFGTIYRLTSFGESHGRAIGGVIDGMPSGLAVDLGRVAQELARRRPGQSNLTSARNESDEIEILSGIFEGRTLGTPIGFVCYNRDCRSSDYDNMRSTYRPSHADYTYYAKYGFRDHRGGGRSSARETLSRVVAGAFARQALELYGVSIFAFTSKIGSIELADDNIDAGMAASVYTNNVRCPHAPTAEAMERLILDARAAGDTLGGVVTGVISGLPAGIGEPVFGKLQAMLGTAMMGINAVKGFEYGMGFAGAGRLGSEMIDIPYMAEDGSVRMRTNHSGGIQGGISTGGDIVFRVAFKPVATLLRPVDTINSDGSPAVLNVKGRHDPCVVPRAVPVVEAMAAITVFDAMLLNRCSRL